ncbi:F-box-like domain superfamily [Arabidopsis suecica]|uniref:F-box-like domain superfamily n=1 Tax=Arabidopsis suecica TaxID=45249 RepID=A0A8T2AI56_ARASU|nr:F-box-like domain superfamily [Arabidopsis suecica]
MKSRRLNVSEDLQTTLRNQSRSSNLINAVENSDPIPTDLMIDILWRLSAKSIARCRCVSKHWASILGLPYFTELFLTKSSARPKLLFACEKDSELIFFSTPQPQNPDESSSSLAATYHMKIPFGGTCHVFSPIHGLSFIRDEQTFKLVSVICNTSTGQTLTLPKPKTRKRIYITSYFGYDPLGKRFKVLSMTQKDGISNEHQVLTLGTKKPSWRMIECCIPHHPTSDGICINGVLYYQASVNISSSISMIVCFDVRSEKFNFIKVMEPFTRVRVATLVNYNGKLALVTSERSSYICERRRRFEMWVLKDPEKHEWSKYVYELSHLWQCVLAEKLLNFVGVNGSTNEIVFMPVHPSDPFYVLYYSLERNTNRVVEIQGMGAFKGYLPRVHIFLDHVEDGWNRVSEKTNFSGKNHIDLWSFHSGQGDMCFALVLSDHVGIDVAVGPDDDGHDNVVPDDAVHDQKDVPDDVIHEKAVPNNLAGYYLKDGSHL